MFVCICKGITDGDIVRAIDDGHTDFRSVRDALGAATQCGQCASLTRELIQSYREQVTADSFYSAA